MSDFSERKIEERLAEPDILDTLRWLAGDRGWQGWVYETAGRAADEIERLRAERDRWRKIADDFAEAGTHPTAHNMVMQDYEETRRD